MVAKKGKKTQSSSGRLSTPLEQIRKLADDVIWQNYKRMGFTRKAFDRHMAELKKLDRP